MRGSLILRVSRLAESHRFFGESKQQNAAAVVFSSSKLRSMNGGTMRAMYNAQHDVTHTVLPSRY